MDEALLSLQRDETVHWYRFFCCSHYFGQQNSACRIESKQTTACVSMVMKEHVTQCNSLFLNSGARWHRAGGRVRLWFTHTTLVTKINSLFAFVLLLLFCRICRRYASSAPISEDWGWGGGRSGEWDGTFVPRSLYLNLPSLIHRQPPSFHTAALYLRWRIKCTEDLMKWNVTALWQGCAG